MLYFLVIELILLFIIGNLLSLKKVDRNSWIGYRTKTSLESDENWYKCNRVLGISLIGCAFIQLCLIVAFYNSLNSELIQGVVAGGVPVLAVVSTFLIIKFKTMK